MTPEAGDLALEPVPASVPRARRWVGLRCRSLGRDDLVEAAETGVSELVTNALIHAPGPITLRVRGTADHPRVEVHDTSPAPPRPLADTGPTGPVDVDDWEQQLSTVGRGLRILASSALAWGAETHAAGKVVWFEPARADTAYDDLAAPVATGTITSGHDPADDERRAGASVGVRLTGVPVGMLAHFRRHHRELRRELRLLALAHGREYPQAERLSRLFTEFDEAVGSGIDALDLGTGPEDPGRLADLVLTVPADAVAATDRMVRLLEAADEFCTAARLLTLARTAEQQRFGRWLLTELARQAEGASPVPWGAAAAATRYSSS